MLVAGGRALVSLLMFTQLESLLLFPLAFAALVLGRADLPGGQERPGADGRAPRRRAGGGQRQAGHGGTPASWRRCRPAS